MQFSKLYGSQIEFQSVRAYLSIPMRNSVLFHDFVTALYCVIHSISSSSEQASFGLQPQDNIFQFFPIADVFCFSNCFLQFSPFTDAFHINVEFFD